MRSAWFLLVLLLAWPLPARADLEDEIPRLRESVLLVVVKMPDGYGSGTAFAVGRDPQGTLLVTNHHVVATAEQVMVLPQGGQPAPARVLHLDPNADLALLRSSVEAPPLRLASRPAREGRTIGVVGYPRVDTMEAESLGVQSSVSRGIVSALRNRRGVPYLQVDAALNPGNSGGPALDWSTTEVVGVAAARLEGAEGLNFLVGGEALRDFLTRHGVSLAETARPRLRPTAQKPGTARRQSPTPTPRPSRPFPGQVVLILMLVGLAGLVGILLMAFRSPGRDRDQDRPTL